MAEEKKEEGRALMVLPVKVKKRRFEKLRGFAKKFFRGSIIGFKWFSVKSLWAIAGIAAFVAGAVLAGMFLLNKDVQEVQKEANPPERVASLYQLQKTEELRRKYEGRLQAILSMYQNDYIDEAAAAKQQKKLISEIQRETELIFPDATADEVKELIVIRPQAFVRPPLLVAHTKNPQNLYRIDHNFIMRTMLKENPIKVDAPTMVAEPFFPAEVHKGETLIIQAITEGYYVDDKQGIVGPCGAPQTPDQVNDLAPYKLRDYGIGGVVVKVGKGGYVGLCGPAQFRIDKLNVVSIFSVLGDGTLAIDLNEGSAAAYNNNFQKNKKAPGLIRFNIWIVQ